MYANAADPLIFLETPALPGCRRQEGASLSHRKVFRGGTVGRFITSSRCGDANERNTSDLALTVYVETPLEVMLGSPVPHAHNCH